MSLQKHPRPDSKPHTPPTVTGAANQHRGSGGHMWHMLLMCLPLIALGLWSLLSGGGAGALIAGLLCAGMMLFMHGNMGSRHKH